MLTSASSLQFNSGASNSADVVDDGSQCLHTLTTAAQPLPPSPSGKHGTKSVNKCDHSSSYGSSDGDNNSSDSGGGSSDSDGDCDNVTDSEPDMKKPSHRRNAILARSAVAKPRYTP